MWVLIVGGILCAAYVGMKSMAQRSEENAAIEHVARRRAELGAPEELEIFAYRGGHPKISDSVVYVWSTLDGVFVAGSHTGPACLIGYGDITGVRLNDDQAVLAFRYGGIGMTMTFLGGEDTRNKLTALLASADAQ